MADLATIVPLGGALFASGWGGQMALAWFKSRTDRAAKRDENEVKLTQHTDKLMFEVLEAARVEARLAREDARIARAESASLRSLESRLAHFEEALDHISTMLAAESEEEVKAARRRATAFLKRMQRLAAARGTIANEVQIALSSGQPIPDELIRPLRQLDPQGEGDDGD